LHPLLLREQMPEQGPGASVLEIERRGSQRRVEAILQGGFESSARARSGSRVERSVASNSLRDSD
ncbi:MAG TPA: hypothetical protein VG817_00810, partial [Gemmatimonadales bacterium]|nr:hypothetical protein [Gemmatimonadales bacterium]